MKNESINRKFQLILPVMPTMLNFFTISILCNQSPGAKESTSFLSNLCAPHTNTGSLTATKTLGQIKALPIKLESQNSTFGSASHNLRTL